MQGASIELGGFKGRTNKLVDGCYSWWVGGCVGLVDGLLETGRPEEHAHSEDAKADHEGEWDDVDGRPQRLFPIDSTLTSDIADSLFNRRALQEYVLFAGQHHAGGLVDKPPKYVHQPYLT